MAPLLITPRILSVQSHVVSGYCGNKSATFPLQLLEFEVDVLNTVQLSNHTQYKVARGQIYGSKDLDEIHAGLRTNNLLCLYDHILSGYVADVSYILSLSKLIKDIKSERTKRKSECLYTFDPVLGDDGVGFYVPNHQNIIEAYKTHLLPLADIIMPNRFEASVLSGLEIGTSPEKAIPQALEAIKVFHRLGVRVVIITSFQIENNKNQLTCILSHNPHARQNDIQVQTVSDLETWVIQIPKLDCPFTGTGDLFAALMTGWLRKTNFNLKKSFENSANTIHDILEDTLSWCHHVNDGTVQSHELRLVQNKMHILSPSNKFKAEKLEIETSLSQNHISNTS